MKYKIFNTVNKVLLAGTLLTAAACTDLEEKVLDENLGSSEINPISALTSAYSRLGQNLFVSTGGLFALQELSSDVAILPTRGSDWGDAGKWRAIAEFTWAPDSDLVQGNFNDLTNGVTRSYTAIEAITLNGEGASKEFYLAEAKGLLYFYVAQLLDLYGQAPYKDLDNLDGPVRVLTAESDIDFVISEVEELIGQLPDLGENQTHIGRFTKQAAYGLLAELYMNRAVYKDRYNASSTFDFNAASVDGTSTNMDKVIYYTSLLINEGRFQLEENYFHNFAIDNNTSREMIFAVVQHVSDIKGSSNDLAYNTMERNQRVTAKNRGTNASCIRPEFFYSWNGNQDDPRFQRSYQYEDGTWFMNDGTDVSVPATSIAPGTSEPWFHFNRGIQFGPQYGPVLSSSGSFEMTGDGRIKVSPLVMEKSTTTLMDFTPDLNFDNPSESVFKQDQINRGARCFKFEFDATNGDNGSSEVDIPIYRLGGMYMLRAEAYFRKGDTGMALNDINTVRTTRTHDALKGSVPGKAIASVDAEVLYKELGYEMYWEIKRRPQMVRFGKFDLPLSQSAKPESQPYRRVFPIPQTIMDIDATFDQNTGYFN
ncbi:RagB/SusD family nutrient uptake outer membrane protein [Myroides indicus]|uniref:RagB/SusD domain-containing protein n=1 Tax=Myroides indicus TaxID=1323422 RepID=A0A4R7F2G0_9FLAO|nr:RagB/SusD family nutrient uptake outer membrane protein [Myroides indicus]TDS63640.1 RagB/SusD domain-containing protein [Myroides indicus]